MGAHSGLKRAGVLLLCLLLLAPLGVRAADEAEDLTRRCVVTCTSGKAAESILTDKHTAVSCRMMPGDRLTVLSPANMGTLVLRLSRLSSTFLLTERDEAEALLSERTVQTDSLALAIPLEKGCRRVQLTALEEQVRVAEVTVLGPGTVPADVPHPEPALDKVDFLLVSTHPDDEWVFLGGVYPIYGGERGLDGTVVYMTLPSWERAHECINGLWLGGVRTHPFFLGFPDIDQRADKALRERCKQEDVTLALVRLYRRIRPLVVVTQDPEGGEYGHWQHKLSATAAYDAAALAADPAYDPQSAEQYGLWTVRKVYQHFAEGLSQVELDVEAPLVSYGGRTALEVARAAFQAHKSQRKTPYRPGHTNPKRGDIVHFGLTWSTVGPDTGNDLFEHISEGELAANWQPTPSPSPEPTPTPTPTATPTPTPTPTATPSPAPSPTPTATPTPTPKPTPAPTATPSAWDRAEDGAAWAADRAGILAAALVGLLVLAVAGRQYKRSRHAKRKP